ncbi:MAG TPA: hypothetical protein VJR90_10420 [Gammaproteobacteria bacterium]|nr:hypothetical protein [Gammaproteobacteria bacterium]
MTTFNEDSRVKTPALLHLTRLGYPCLSLKGACRDLRNDIFLEIFESALLRVNSDLRRLNNEHNEETGEYCRSGDGTALGNRITEVHNGSTLFAGNAGRDKKQHWVA